MRPEKVRAWMQTLGGMAIGLVLIIAAVGLVLTLRVSADLREEQTAIRQLNVQTQQLLESAIKLSEQHEEAQTRAEERLRRGIAGIEELLQGGFEDLLRRIRNLSFAVEQQEGRTVIVVEPEAAGRDCRRGACARGGRR